jgi:hypothetical protein
LIIISPVVLQGIFQSVEKLRIAGVQGAACSLPESRGRASCRVWDSVPLSFKRPEKGEFLAILERMAKKRGKICKIDFSPCKESV